MTVFLRTNTQVVTVPPRTVQRRTSTRNLLFHSIAFLLGTIVSIPLAGLAQSAKPIYYWVSHGPPSNPIWSYFLQGAEMWAQETGADVRTSFHSVGD